MPPRLSAEQAKHLTIEMISKGGILANVMRIVGRAESTYYEWRATDPEFAARIDNIRAIARGEQRKAVPDFPEFCREYLGQPLYGHQLQWVDLIEGREPRNLHPSQIYEKGDSNFVLINTPPEHSKTTTLSINYATWRIVRDPNIRILWVSKTQELAKQMMWAIKSRLTHPRYLNLQTDFGPPGGYRADSDVWAADKVYLGSERDSGEKDPTMRAVGLGGHIYGSRLDLTFCDDTVVLSNAHEFEKQIRWLQQEVLTRGGPHSKLCVIGTRVDAVDLYSELRNPERYPSGESPWTYLSQPAVLEYAERAEDWVTLWPRAEEPWQGSVDQIGADGMFARWDGKYLHKRRGLLAPKTWALAYMQASIAEDAVFRQEIVRAAVNGRRQPGVMTSGVVGHRDKGMEGLYVIGSMDPAMVGYTGVVVYAVDRHTKRRYVLQVLNQPRATPNWIRQTIKDLTDAYQIHEWRIEKNAFQAFLTQDPELQEWLGSLGVRLSEHLTGKNKWDLDYGIASIATVFDNGYIELPATHMVEACKTLVEQLITWAPETKNKTDLVMALWFAEIRARELIQANSPAKGRNNFVPNRFVTRQGRANQMVVNLNDLAIAARG